MRARQPWRNWTTEQVDDLIFYCALGVILGGRIGWMLFYGTERILEDPLSVLRIWEGGMSFHGGMLGVAVAVWLFARSTRKSLFDVGDFAERDGGASEARLRHPPEIEHDLEQVVALVRRRRGRHDRRPDDRDPTLVGAQP